MTIKPQWDHDHYQVSSPFVVNVNIDGPQSTTHNESSYNSFPANSTKLRSVLCQQCNLAYSCETYQRKFPLTILSLNGKCFDHLIAARGILQHALNYKCKYTDPNNGKVFEKPLIQDKPKFIFKSVNEIYAFQLKFACVYGKDCICKVSKEKRKDMRLRGEYTPTCPFERQLVFKDVLLFTNTSLSSMIEDLHIVREKEGLTLKQTFPNSYRWCKRQGFEEEAITTILSSKADMPYEYISSFSFAESVKEPPEPSAFKSILRNSDGLNAEQHRDFISMWNAMKVENLSTMLKYYNILDSLYLADTSNFYFTQLHETTKLWVTHAYTISSFSVFSSLYNSKSPENKRRRLFLPFCNKLIYEAFQGELVGGLASSQARFFEATWGMVDQEEVLKDNNGCIVDIPKSITQQLTFDFNGLYSSCLTGLLPYKNYLLHMEHHPSVFYTRIVKALEALDLDFFHDLATEKDTGLFIECTVDYNKKESLKTGFDFAQIPILTKIDEKLDLTNDQRKSARESGRNLKNDNPKLISDMKKGRNFHFIHNLLFLIVHQSVKIVKVHNIISFTHAPFLRPYMMFLQSERNKTKSKVMQKIIKSLGNSLSGANLSITNL